MSRIGKQPIQVPDKVRVMVDGRNVQVEGPKGKLSCRLPVGVSLTVTGSIAHVAIHDAMQRNLFGLARTLVQNMLVGVSQGYIKELEIIGIGYKAEQKGTDLILHVGYSSPKKFSLPIGVSAEVYEKQTRIRLSGADKQLVGNIAAELRKVRKPDVYKGKGIKYLDEVIRRKAGKAVAGGAKT